MVEGECRETEHLLEGRTVSMAPEIDGRVLINELADFPVRPGDIVRAKVTETHAYDLVARVIGRA
jgi:ribosomal protein S12 methylthiotransferase